MASLTPIVLSGTSRVFSGRPPPVKEQAGSRKLRSGLQSDTCVSWRLDAYPFIHKTRGQEKPPGYFFLVDFPFVPELFFFLPELFFFSPFGLATPPPFAPDFFPGSDAGTFSRASAEASAAASRETSSKALSSCADAAATGSIEGGGTAVIDSAGD